MPLPDTMREFDDEARYEREKHARKRPQELEVMNLYIFRTRLSILSESRGEEERFGEEELVILIEPVFLDGEYYVVPLFGKMPRGENVTKEVAFNKEGFAIMQNEGPNAYAHLPKEVEMGYIVGSVDPWDISLAELTSSENFPAPPDEVKIEEGVLVSA